MCGKPAKHGPASASDEDATDSNSKTPKGSKKSRVKKQKTEDVEKEGETNGVEDKVEASTSKHKSKQEETPEEKILRRKAERKKRTEAKRQHNGNVSTANTPKKLRVAFNQVWDREYSFVTKVMQCLPEVRNPGLFEEMDEDYLDQRDDSNEVKEKQEKAKWLARVKRELENQGGVAVASRATSYEELKERVRRKREELAQKPNEKKREKKKIKLETKRQEAKSNKGKKLISQSASTASADTSTAPTSTATDTPEHKPLLKKKPVVKANGEIVYSKFDFISKEARNSIDTSTLAKSKKAQGKQTADELLKQVEKQDKKISNLTKQGKKAEAVDLAETQKWETALKRADGVKVKDDPYLLKKSIKKQEKLKQLTKKKWKERMERVETQKDQRQQKRQDNLKARQDGKKKKLKKTMRKRGRIA